MFTHQSVQLMLYAPLCLGSGITTDLHLIYCLLLLLLPRYTTHRERVGALLYDKPPDEMGEDRRFHDRPGYSAALAVLWDAAYHRGCVVPVPGGHDLEQTRTGSCRIKHRNLLRTIAIQTINKS